MVLVVTSFVCDRSVGRQYEFQGETYTVEELTENRYAATFSSHSWNNLIGLVGCLLLLVDNPFLV